MIGEGNVVEIVVRVVGVEGAPAAVLALHADDPFGGALDRLIVALVIGAVKQQGPPPPCRRRRDSDRCGIGTPSRPAAGRAAARPSRPRRRESDARRASRQALSQARVVRRHARFEQGEAREPRVPDRARGRAGRSGSRRSWARPTGAFSPRPWRPRGPDGRARSPAHRRPSRRWPWRGRCRPGRPRHIAAER